MMGYLSNGSGRLPMARSWTLRGRRSMFVDNRDGKINAIDLQQVAPIFGQKPTACP
jgi:hypothetical protein